MVVPSNDAKAAEPVLDPDPGETMSSSFRSLLGPTRRCAKGAQRQGLKTKAMITHAARAVVRECLKDARGGVTT